MKRCCKNVIPENAARQFSSPAPVLKRVRVQELLSQHVGMPVLDVGAGNLRNSIFLQRKGFCVTAVDLPGIENRFPENYRRFRRLGGRVHLRPINTKGGFPIAVCTFVIETVCQRDIRFDLLTRVRHALTEPGVLVISVRGPADLVTAHAKGRRCGDGYITPNKSFARSFTRIQLRALLVSAGFDEVEFLHKKHTKAPELLHALAHRKKA